MTCIAHRFDTYSQLFIILYIGFQHQINRAIFVYCPMYTIGMCLPVYSNLPEIYSALT